MIYRLPQTVLNSAERLPEKVAFRCGRESLTYAELATRIQQLAYVLKNAGVRRGDLVAVYLNRSIETVIALHGIMLAGAAYVPLNPKAPAGFTRFQLGEVVSKVAVTNAGQQKNLARILADGGADDSITLSLQTVIGASAEKFSVPGLDTIDWPEVWKAPAGFTGPPNTLDTDLAYLMYTSGSTGRPKGMMHTHRSGLGFARLMAHHFGLDENDRFGNHAPIYFDISTPAYFTAPLVGATTVIATDAHTIFPNSLSQLIETESISVWYSVPLALTQMLEKGAAEQRDWSSLRHIMYAGEPWAPKYIRRLMQHCPSAVISNLYGPAETNVCTFHSLIDPPDGDESIPIGKVWNNTDGILLDDQDNILTGPGSGELLISSITTMDGYYARPDLNLKAFYHQPTSGGGSRTFYRTGDLVKLDDSGRMHFLGRKDKQLKVRGYRVETTAVENRLLTHSDVLEVAVFAKMSEEATLRLEAAVISREGVPPNEQELLTFAAGELPWYAVPEKIHFVQHFPRTGSDKIDRKALSAQVGSSGR